MRQGQKPRRGDLFIGENRDPPPFFLFFSGAAGGQFDRRARFAPLKNKKKERGGCAGAINRPPLAGFEPARRGRERWADI